MSEHMTKKLSSKLARTKAANRGHLRAWPYWALYGLVAILVSLLCAAGMWATEGMLSTFGHVLGLTALTVGFAIVKALGVLVD